MFGSALRRDACVPLFALFIAAVTTIVLAAELGLAFCARRVSMPICDGHGLHSASTTSGVCPITLGLVLVGAGSLAFAVLALRHGRRPTARFAELLHWVAGRRLLSTTGALALTAAVPVALTAAIEPQPAGAVGVVLLLGAIFVAALGTAAAATLGARCAVAFVCRAVFRLLAVLASLPARVRLCVRWIAAVSTAPDATTFSSGRGLRAPPALVC